MADRIKNYQQEADQITTLKAIRTDLGVTPSSYTPDATVVTKDRVVTFAQAEEELVVLSDIEKGVKQQIVDVDIAQKDISNIKALLQGHLYDYQTDNSSAYTKSVPSGAMPYAGLEKVGGKTIVWNQYGKIPTNSSNAGVSWTNDNGVLHFTGTATGIEVFIFTQDEMPVTVGQKIAFGNVIENNSTGNPQIQALIKHDGTETVQGTTQGGCGIITAGYTGTVLVYLICYANDVVDMKIAPFVSNLTLLAGAGNEPATVENLQQMFPADFYSYNAGTLLSAGVTSVVSASKNLLDQTPFLNATSYHTEYDGYWQIQTYWITQKYPDNNYANNASPIFTQPTLTLSFEAKRPNTGDSNIYFTASLLKSDGTRVNEVYTVTDTWKKFTVTLTGNTDGAKIGFSYYESTNILIRNMQVEANSVATDYSPYGTIATYPIPAEVQALEGYGWSAGTVYNYVDFERKVFVKNVGIRAYASGDESDSTVVTDGNTTYYPLNTPIETDISEYLTDENLINVEAGGTLTFENQHGDDYRLPVPSEETYMIDLQSAIGG